MKVRSVRVMRGAVRFAVHCLWTRADETLGMKLDLRSEHDAMVRFFDVVDVTGATNAMVGAISKS